MLSDTDKDTLRRFVLDNANVRGEWVHLDKTWQTVLERADYPDTIRNVLGEAFAAVALLSATIKHQGSLILQIRGDGPIHLLVVHATPQGTLRGLARWNTEPDNDADLSAMFGKAQMVITMEAATKTHERYQGIIALEGDTIADTLEGYFSQSEQLPTRLWLTADQNSASGMLLQRLADAPNADDERDAKNREDWSRNRMLLDTLTADELQTLAPDELIYRLFHEEAPRLFDAKSLVFHCPCSLEKIENTLKTLGRAEAESIIAEQGKIEVTCEFCNAVYALDAIDTARLFTDSPTHTPHPTNQTIH